MALLGWLGLGAMGGTGVGLGGWDYPLSICRLIFIFFIILSVPCLPSLSFIAHNSNLKKKFFYSYSAFERN